MAEIICEGGTSCGGGADEDVTRSWTSCLA
jgi:hypothetical protein